MIPRSWAVFVLVPDKCVLFGVLAATLFWIYNLLLSSFSLISSTYVLGTFGCGFHVDDEADTYYFDFETRFFTVVGSVFEGYSSDIEDLFLYTS